MPLPKAPPQEVPDDCKDDVLKLSEKVQTLFVMKELPWFVQAQMARQGYVSLEDLADRWDKPEEARKHGPQQMAFRDGQNNFDGPYSTFTAMRLFQAVKAAKEMTSGMRALSHPSSLGPGSRSGAGIEALCDRKQLLRDWESITGCIKPKLELQASDNYLKKQVKPETNNLRFARAG